MLTQIQVRNFTIVDHLDLELESGMTVLTGETGAGKSILLDALMLALGTRADSQTIRQGCDRADITAVFNIKNHPQTIAWLQNQDFDADDECIVRRTLNIDGKSKGFINGNLVAMQMLRELGELLVDIHGQHAFQSLLKREYQRQALDNYAGHFELLTQVSESYKIWKKLDRERSALSQHQQERESKIELLEYQTRELSDLALEDGEFEKLEEEFHKLSNLTKIQQSGQQICYTLNNDENSSITQQVGELSRQLSEIQQFDTSLTSSAELLNDGTIILQEAAAELSHYLENLDFDPQRLEFVNERLSLIHDLARKHHSTPAELPALFQQLTAELDELRTMTEHSNSLDSAIQSAGDVYRESASQLSVQRKTAAQSLAKSITKNMRQLGMKSGIFDVTVEEMPDFTPFGTDSIEFLVCTNPGQKLNPLNKVASGGELSRISLAIQVITANKGSVRTLIFDEVDVGIGGGTAEVVGRLLKQLSNKKQVLCVTHQPQVAALGHHHLHVSKRSVNNATNTSIKQLKKDQRTDEIARMLGGLKITSQTLSHAKEMIEHAED